VHGMSTSMLREVFRAITSCYDSSAWWGFTPTDDRQHLDGFIRRDLDIVGIIIPGKKLFQLVLTNPNHVLSSLLPDKTDQR